MGISELQTFLYLLASRFARPPDRSHRCPRLRQGSRGFYVRAEHASLPPHASDMLAVRIQVIDGERTFTPPDSQPYRLLRTPARHFIHPVGHLVSQTQTQREIGPQLDFILDIPGGFERPVAKRHRIPHHHSLARFILEKIQHCPVGDVACRSQSRASLALLYALN